MTPLARVGQTNPLQRVLAALIAVVVLLGLGAAARAEVDTNVSSGTNKISGHFEYVVKPATECLPSLTQPLTVQTPMCEEGQMYGSLRGSMTAYVTALVPSVDLPKPTENQFLVTFGNARETYHLDGGVLYGIAHPAANLDSVNGKGEFVCLVEFTGGTGKYSGAKGYLQIRGHLLAPLDPTKTTPVRSSYVGELVLP